MLTLQPITPQQAYNNAANGYVQARHSSSDSAHLNCDADAGQAQTQLLGALYNEVTALRTEVGHVLNRRI